MPKAKVANYCFNLAVLSIILKQFPYIHFFQGILPEYTKKDAHKVFHSSHLSKSVRWNILNKNLNDGKRAFRFFCIFCNNMSYNNLGHTIFFHKCITSKLKRFCVTGQQLLHLH